MVAPANDSLSLISSESPVVPGHTESGELEIASLRRTRIADMSNHELVRAIRISRLPFLRESDLARLPFLDRETLVRLVYIARQFCRRASAVSTE